MCLKRLLTIHISGFLIFIIILIALYFTVPQSVAQSHTIESCPDEHLALTPAPLETEWAIEWWIPRHESKLEEPGREQAKLLFLGDSITQGWEGAGRDVWDEYYEPIGAFNLGFSGDRTENVLWRLQHGEVDGLNPELVILMIGTNNTGHRQDPPECTARGISMILDELKERLPGSQILLLAIFPRESSPDGSLRQLNNQINRLISGFADHERVYFENINEVFLTDQRVLTEEVMPDMLHPEEHGYRLWAKAMEPILSRILNRN
jgi:lysophospholipase L1-like esterase